MDTQNDESSSENWDWEESKYQLPKPLTARERFAQVLSEQKNRFAGAFNVNPLYDETKVNSPPPSPKFDETFNFDKDYAEWVPYEPTEEENSTYSSYEVLSETEDSTYESDSELNDPVHKTDDRLNKELKNLYSNLSKVENRCNMITAEKEMLLSQLDDCEDLYDRLLDEADQLEDAIEEKKDEIEAYEASLKTKIVYEKENKIMAQLIEDIDEFSQSTQLLLNNALYFDMEDLIMKHIKKCDSSDPEKVKKSIIAEANIIRKDQLKSAVHALNCYLDVTNHTPA